jgi:hypothetical protein
VLGQGQDYLIRRVQNAVANKITLKAIRRNGGINTTGWFQVFIAKQISYSAANTNITLKIFML